MKIKSLIFAVFAVFALFVACDVISEEDRLEVVQLEPSKRNVLLLEFTGWKCVNCPGAAIVAHTLVSALNENIVVVAMHPEGHGFTSPENSVNALSTTEAMEYLEFYSDPNSSLDALPTDVPFPTGVVNGVKFGGEYLQGKDEWIAQVMGQRAIAPDCFIDLTYSKDGGHKVVATITPDTAMNMNYNVSLQMWLVENNIVAPQASQGSNYVHQHVFRKALNPLWGDELGVLSGVTTKEYSFEIESRYVVDNCAVVAVLINTDTKEVIQTSQVALGNAAH